jgi:hypothetical protein
MAVVGRARLDDLWARWLADGQLPPDEEQELARALSEDEAARAEWFQDQRIEGALCALGRTTSEGDSFARRFAERVAAERDGRVFVSSVARRIEAQAPGRRRWVALPAAAAVLALVVALWPRGPRPSSGPAGRDLTAEAAPQPVRASGARLAPVARVGGVQGAYFLDGARHIEAQDGAWLMAGWGLMTAGPDSHAALVFPDGTSLELEGDSSLLQAQVSRGKEAFLARGRLAAVVTAQPAGRPMLISTPHAQARVVGTRFTLIADRRSTRLEVQEGGVEIARVGGGPPALVRAAEHALITEGRAGPVRVHRRGLALLLVGTLALQYDDERIKRRLEGLGFEVDVRGSGPPDPEELRRVSLILVSSSVFSLDLNTQYRDVPLPLMVWEPSLYDDFGMTGPEEQKGCGVAASQGEALIRSPQHPIASGLDGTVTLVTNGRNLHHLWMSHGVPGPAATAVATWPGLPHRAVLFAYERGAAMPGLAAAPARRVGFFFYDDGRLHLTEAGWTLFDGAVNWLVDQ